MITNIPTGQRPGRAPRPIQDGSSRDVAEAARMNPWLLWRPESRPAEAVLTVAELAECRCPDLCNRDHDNE